MCITVNCPCKRAYGLQSTMHHTLRSRSETSQDLKHHYILHSPAYEDGTDSEFRNVSNGTNYTTTQN